MMISFSLTAISLLIIVGVVTKLSQRMKLGQLERSVRSYSVAAVVSMLLAAIAVFFSPVIWLTVLASISILLNLVWLVLRVVAPQSKQKPNFSVGQKLPQFSLLDDNSEQFDMASLSGKPILLKFFRGHW